MANDGHVKIGTELDESGLKKGLSGLSGSIKSGLSGLGSFAQKGFSAISTGVTAATAALGAAAAGVATLGTAAATASIKVGSEFEAQMSRVQAISGATGSELEALHDQAIQLGADTAFSASSAAQGMENLAAAGFATQEIMDAMPGLLDLAAASGEDLATSSDIAASTLRGFGLAASEAGHVADVLAANANMTNSSVYETGEAMKYIAPVASAVGLSLEEVAAAIGIMANAGIQGSQAGTTLRGALSRLAKPTDPMIDKMEELGLSFYNADGQMKSLSEMVGMLSESMAGLTDEQKQNALVTLFGQESLSGMLALMNEGEEELTSLTDSFRTADGAAAEAAITMQDNLQGSVEQMKGSLETLGILMYEDISDPLKDLAQQATDSINDLTVAFQEGGFDGLITAGSDMAANLLLGIAQELPRGIEIITQSISTFAQSVSANTPQFIEAGIRIIQEIASGLLSAGSSLFSMGATILSDVLFGISSNMPAIAEKGVEIIGSITQGITSNLPGIVSSGVEIITSLVNGIAQTLPSLLNMAVETILTFVLSLTDPANLTQIVQAGLNLIVQLISGITQAIPLLLEAAPTIIANLVVAIVQAIPLLASAALQIMTDLNVMLIKCIPYLLLAVPNILDRLKDAFVNTNWAEVGRNIIEGVKNGIVGAAGRLVDAAVQAAKDAVEAVKGWLGINSPSTLMRDLIGKNMVAGIAVGIEDGTRGVVSSASKSVKKLVDGMRAASNMAYPEFRTPRTGNGGTEQAPEGSGGVVNNYIFNQPVETPDETARAIRKVNEFGLAGAR